MNRQVLVSLTGVLIVLVAVVVWQMNWIPGGYRPTVVPSGPTNVPSTLATPDATAPTRSPSTSAPTATTGEPATSATSLATVATSRPSASPPATASPSRPTASGTSPTTTVPTPVSPAATASRAAPSTGRYDVFELTLTYPSDSLRNPWEDAVVKAAFTSASGKTTTVPGFYYDTNTYKVRFVPDEPGTYSYTATIAGPSSFAPVTGRFTASPSSGKGFIHRLSANPARLGFDDGTLFNALGINDCWYTEPGDPSQLSHRLFIGAGQGVDPDTYFATYASAGFNLIRWGIDNCSFPIGGVSTNGDTFLIDQGKAGDQLLQTATRHGFHVMLTLFRSAPYPDAATNPNEQRALEQYVDYAMARYGAYVDIWELINESDPKDVPDSWLRLMADYIHTHDPYHRIVTNSNPRDGDWNYLDARSPHWYVDDPPAVADVGIQATANRFKQNNLPVIFGEYGNATCNWNPTSALGMRLHLWSAFFNAAEVIFWNSSASRNYCHSGAANIYLGSEERRFTSVLQNFTANVDPRVHSVPVTELRPGVRGYLLGAPTMLLGYFHNYANAGEVTTPVNVDAPLAGTATWLDPATGKILATQQVNAGPQTLTSPPFTVDLALRIQ